MTINNVCHAASSHTDKGNPTILLGQTNYLLGLQDSAWPAHSAGDCYPFGRDCGYGVKKQVSEILQRLEDLYI